MSYPQGPYDPQYPPQPGPPPGGQNPYGQQPPPYGAPPPNPYGPYGAPPPMPPAPKSSNTGAVVAIVVLVLVVIGGAAGAFIYLGSAEDDTPSATESASEAATDEPSAETDVPNAHPDAIDLTEGLGPFDPASGDYAPITAAEDLWVPLGDPWEWIEQPIQSDESRSSWIKEDADGSSTFYACADAEQRGGDLPEFTDYDAAFAFNSEQYLAVQSEAAEISQTGEETFTHYVIDGRAAYLAEADYAWAVDNNGDAVDSTAFWGFLAVDRGEDPTMFCTFSSWNSPTLYGETIELLLGVRATE